MPLHFAIVHADFDFRFLDYLEPRTSRARSDINVCREASTSNIHNTATALFEFVQHAVARRVLRGSRHNHSFAAKNFFFFNLRVFIKE